MYVLVELRHRRVNRRKSIRGEDIPRAAKAGPSFAEAQDLGRELIDNAEIVGHKQHGQIALQPQLCEQLIDVLLG